LVAHENSWFLDCSLILGDIGPDTYYYYQNVDPYTDDVIGNYRSPPGMVFDTHGDSLSYQALMMEARFTEWRAAFPKAALGVSVSSVETFGHVLQNHVSELAIGAVNHGHRRVTAEVREAKHFNQTTKVMRRAMNRIAADLQGLDRDTLLRIDAEHTAYLQSRLYERPQDVEGIPFYQRDLRPIKNAKAFIRREQKHARSIMKRSMKFLSALIGDDATRMFVSGDRIRIEGQHCVYEIHRTGRMAYEHGGSGLKVFTKDEDIHLCDICIYTPNVPIFDHVAGIVMHIKAGEEDKILEIGNPYNLSEAAKQQEWLVPYLPKPRVPQPPVEQPDRDFMGIRAVPYFGDLPQVYRGADREQRLRTMRHLIGRHLYDDLGLERFALAGRVVKEQRALERVRVA
jgi:hypothetical protein